MIVQTTIGAREETHSGGKKRFSMELLVGKFKQVSSKKPKSFQLKSQLAINRLHASIQILIPELKAVVFERDELNFGKVSQITALLPLLTCKKSNCEVEIFFFESFRNEQSVSGIEPSTLTA